MALLQDDEGISGHLYGMTLHEMEWMEYLLALKVICKTWANSVGNIQSAFPIVGWNLASHVPVEWEIILL